MDPTRDSFTPTEAAALVDLPDRRIRKEVEHGIIPAMSPPRLEFEGLVYLRVLRLIGIELSIETRSRLFKLVAEALKRSAQPQPIEIAPLLTLDVASARSDVIERVLAFRRWQARLVTNDDILGGETVFPNSRVSVRHIGEVLERGEAVEVVREDYPRLSDQDLEFARMFVRAYPRVGRPPADRTTTP